MSEGPRVDREGIHIERGLADSIAVDEDLDSNVEGEYAFPDVRRRRLSGYVLAVFAALAVAVIDGGWRPAAGLAGLAAWQFLSAWPLAVDEREAFLTACAEVGFPVGHASAAVRFKGWRSRPRWSVVLYSAAEPADRRALVVVDAVSGDVVEAPYVEAVEPVR